MDISLVIPAFNEGACVAATIQEAAGALARMGRSHEIVVVDDGSTDNTRAILSELEARVPNLRTIVCRTHAGQTAACDAGFRAARGDIVVLMDADGQNDPADIPALVDALGACDACCGYRHPRRDPLSRRMAGRLANTVRRAVLHDGIRDSGCSLKAIKRDFLNRLPMHRPGMHRFIPALLLMQGATIQQRAVNHRHRTAGRSKYTNRGRLLRALSDLVAVKRMQHELVPSAAPLHKQGRLANIRAYKRYWRTDLIIAAVLTALSLVLSHRTIDLAIARWFFNRVDGGWPDPARQPWQWLYDTPPIILAVIIPVCGLFLLLSALHLCSSRIRIRSIYLLLALWLGAGLIVEGIFKMNWGRPKPAQLTEFGGWLDFHAALAPGVAGRGRSFPSGHSAIGFFLTAFYFILRRDHKPWAILALFSGLGAGTAIGMARMRVGGHFASDVAWSAAIIFSINLLVYYGLLNVPAYEDKRDGGLRPRHPWRSIILLLVIPVLLQALVMTLSPVYRSFCYELPPSERPEAVRITTAGADLELRFSRHTPLRVAGELIGYGLAGAAYTSTLNHEKEAGARITEIRCRKSGWFFRSGGSLSARIPADTVTRLTLDTSGADIRLAPDSIVPTNTVIDIRSGKLAPFL